MTETKWNARIPKLVLSKRYVDDILIFSDRKNFPNVLNFLTSAHPNLSVLHGEKANYSINFLDTKLTRRSNDIINKSTHRKSRLHGQYFHCISLYQFYTKANRDISSADDLPGEKDLPWATPIRNGHQAQSIEFHDLQSLKGNPIHKAEKKAICIRLAS